MKSFQALLIVLIVQAAGCSALNLPTAAPQPVEETTPTPATTPTQGATTTPGPLTLRLWLPPEFDPRSGTLGGNLLQARLDSFVNRRPAVHIEVRLKALDGPGGLLDALTSASAAAPLALPDLVAVPRPVLEAAALKGLLHPFDILIQETDGDWYEYAQQMARLQTSAYGLPFAGDSLALVYRTEAEIMPPHDMQETLELTGPVIFPAADPQALFTLTLYLAAGGAIQDEQGRPLLESEPLVRVLAFYQEAAMREVLPFWLTQYQTSQQSWDAFKAGNANLVVSWSSAYLKEQATGLALAPIPTPDGKPFTLATGWAWALANPNPERQAVSAELAQFLTDSRFLARWTAALGYLPTRPSSLSAWLAASPRAIDEQILLSAHLYPSTDVMAILAPPLAMATVNVLKQEQDAQTAAQEAIDSLLPP